MAAVNITTGAAPEVSRNTIVGGVFVFKRGCGVVRDNDISSPAPKKAAAVEVRDDGSSPKVTGNRIHHTHGVAAYIHLGGGGVLTGNTITDTDAECVEVADPGTEPVVRDNVISNGKSVGIRIHSGASATVDGNEIRNQAVAGLLVHDGAATQSCPIRRNRFLEMPRHAVLVKGQGVEVSLVENEFDGCSGCAVRVDRRSIATLKANFFHGAGAGTGVVVSDGSSASLAENEFVSLGGNGVEAVGVGSSVELEDNRFVGTAGCGVLVRNAAEAVMSSNTFDGTTGPSAVRVSRGSKASLTRNVVINGAGHGVVVSANSQATLLKDTINGNKGCGVDVSNGSTATSTQVKVHTCVKGGLRVRRDGDRVMVNKSFNAVPPQPAATASSAAAGGASSSSSSSASASAVSAAPEPSSVGGLFASATSWLGLAATTSTAAGPAPAGPAGGAGGGGGGGAGGGVYDASHLVSEFETSENHTMEMQTARPSSGELVDSEIFACEGNAVEVDDKCVFVRPFPPEPLPFLISSSDAVLLLLLLLLLWFCPLLTPLRTNL
jgi:hypothetical protein